jgi:hypothetical protein
MKLPAVVILTALASGIAIGSRPVIAVSGLRRLPQIIDRMVSGKAPAPQDQEGDQQQQVS